MSTGARVTIGILFAFSGICFVLIGKYLGGELPLGSTPFYGMAAFCAVVTLASFVRRSQPITLRAIGAVIFALYVWYACSTFGDERFGRAIVGFITIGIPAGYVMIRGAYPIWGKYGMAFHSKGDLKTTSRTKPKHAAQLPRTEAISLTPGAAERIRQILADHRLPGSTLARVGVKRTDGAWYHYEFSFVQSIQADRDVLCESHGIALAIDKSHLPLLHGTVIDFESGPATSGFRFNNPNVQEATLQG